MTKLPLLALSVALVGCSCPFDHKPVQPAAHGSDSTIQKIADDSVSTTLKSLHAKRMVVIVADPKTGRILAMTGRKHGSNKPTDDPVAWSYEPASTFKPVVAVAALNEGVMGRDEKINCEHGAFPYGGKVIKDHVKYGNLTFEEILMKSSNIGAAKMSLRLKDSVYYDYIRRFGFGEKTLINVSGESAGLVIPVDRWGRFTKTRMAFGQSIAVTPIQLTMAYCALANGGKLMKPVIGDEKPVVVRKVCTKEIADAVKNAMEKSVSQQGTAPLAQVQGVRVGGKSGTSQAITPNGRYAENKYVTSFVGFFPVEKPRYVSLVVVDQADLKPEQNFGGLVAAPIFSEVAGKIKDRELK